MNRSIWKPCVAVALLTWGIALVLPEPWLDWSDTPSRTRMPEVRARAVQWEGFTRWRDGGILLVHDTRLWTDRFPASEAVELRLERIWGDPHFDLDFGRLPSGLLSFRHHPASERRGVFLMRDDGGEEALLTDFPAHYPTRIHKLALRVEGTRLELELDGNRAQAELPTSLSEIFGEVHCHTGVVRGDMGLGSITIEAGGRTEARADFSHFPIILDLGFRLSERANDRLPRSLFVSLLALAAGLATRAGRAISSAGEVEDFDFLPLQLAALLVMARLFNLPLSIALLFALLWALLRVDQAIRGSRPDGPFSRRHRGLLLLSPIVLALTVLHLIDPTLDTPTSSPHAVWVVPVFVIATLVGIWGSPGFPRTSALRHAAQWGLLPLVELAQPGHHHVPLAAAIALPWTLFVAGRVLVRRGRWFVSLPLSILGFGLFATCLEWALRAESAPLVSLRLDYPERIQSIFWNVEEHTDLLDNHRHQETLFFREVEFAREKPPGVTRIVCLGSSSTWASGLPEDPAHGYPYELGEILAAGGARVEVINGGIQGRASLC